MAQDRMLANVFYDPGGKRAAKVDELFTRIAARYDLINDLQSFGLHRLWKRKVVQLANCRPGDSALDVCCGTGDLAFRLSEGGAQVVGLDFNERMLSVAEARGAKAVSKPRFLQGNAQQLPFADGTFEVVTVGYGLRNLESWQAGLREMERVCRAGGRLLVLDFGKPDNRFWRTLYFGYLRFFVPVLGLVMCGSASAYAYILESLQRYPAQRGVESEMRSMGLREVKVHHLLGGMMTINYGEKPA